MPQTSRHFWNRTASHATQNPFSSFRLRLGIIAAVLHSWPAANRYCNGRVGRRGRHKLCCAKANASCWPGFSLLSNLKNVKNIIKKKKKKKKEKQGGLRAGVSFVGIVWPAGGLVVSIFCICFVRLISVSFHISTWVSPQLLWNCKTSPCFYVMPH